MASTKRKVQKTSTAAKKSAAKKSAGKKSAGKKSTAKKTVAKKKLNPIPRGYRTVTAALSQDDAKATIAFCKKAFGAKLDSKMAIPGGKIMHAELTIGDSKLMVSDALMGPAQPGSLFLYVPAVDKTVAKAEKAGAKVVTPPEDMFWGDRFAQVVDPQGNSWSIASRVEQVKPAELKKRVKAEGKKMKAAMA